MLRRIVPILFVALFLQLPSARAQDAAELIVRLNELENQMRNMAGQIEQLQHENRLLKDQLRQLGGNVGAAPAAPPAAVPPAAVPPAAVPPAAVPPATTAPMSPATAPGSRPDAPAGQRRGDSFDPARQPDAPGAPRMLGSTPPSRPLTGTELGNDTPGYSVPQGALPEPNTTTPGSPAHGSPAYGGIADGAAPATQTPVGPSVAATGSGDPRADYDEAYEQFARGRYAEAEMGFRKFLQSHPRDAMVPEARYWLGETYLATKRPRDAAEQFLNLTTEHASSDKAPSAMLKLGSALVGLDAADRACAIFSELSRKYPKASQSFKDELERERRRAKCP